VASYAVGATDYTVLANAGSNNITVTLPDATLNSNRILNFKKIDATANTVTINSIATTPVTGTSVHFNSGSTSVTGVGTSFSSQFTSGNIITDGLGFYAVVQNAFSNTNMSLQSIWTGATETVNTAAKVLYVQQIDASSSSHVLSAQNETVTLQSDGSNWWII
jgi:hypothetical protein